MRGSISEILDLKLNEKVYLKLNRRVYLKLHFEKVISERVYF